LIKTARFIVNYFNEREGSTIMNKLLLSIISICMVASSISVVKADSNVGKERKITEIKRGATRLPTKEQLKTTYEKRVLKAKMEAAFEKPKKAAEMKMKRDKLKKYQNSMKPRSTVNGQERLKRVFRKSNRWLRFGNRGPVSDRWIQASHPATRNGPTLLLNGASSATIEAQEAFQIALTFSTGENSALIDVWYDVDGDQVVDSLSDISIFAFMPPGKGDEEGQEEPFWIYDNSREDENLTDGEFLVTIDEFPYMDMAMIFQATDGGGTGEAYLTVNPLTGDYTASGTVTLVTAPTLVFFSHEREDEPFMTFTNDAGVFSFDFLNLEGGFMLGAVDVSLGISSGQYLFHGRFFQYPEDLSGVTLDITRNATMSGSVSDDETGSGIEDVWLGAFSGMGDGGSFGFAMDILMSYTTSSSNGQFTLPLQGGHIYQEVEASHPDYMDDFCLDFPVYVSANETLTVNCELEAWPAFIEGYVTDAETNEPLWDIDVEIRIWDGDHPRPPMMGGPMGGPDDGDREFWNDTWTDVNGYYRMGTILGTGELCAFDWSEREYQGYCEFDFEVNQALVDYDFELHPFDGAITGVITDASTGEPLIDANVWAHSDGWDWKFFQDDRTDHEGRYNLPVMNGTYVVCADKWWDGYEMECTDDVTVQDNIVTENLALYPPDGIIQGYVYNADTQEPISGVGVDAYSEDNFYYWAETDHSGFFKMGVSNGTYDICFYNWPSVYVDTCISDIVVSDNVQEMTVNLTPIEWDGAIAGTVVDDFGNPVVAIVGAIDTSNWDMVMDKLNFNVTVTDLDGEYVLPLNNGEYTAGAMPLGWGYLWDMESGITVSDDTTTVDFVTPVVTIDAVISGTVTDTTDNPLEEAWVSASPWLSELDNDLWGGGELFFEAETDASGSYEMDVMGFDNRYYRVYADYWDPETWDLWVGGVDSVSVLTGETATVNLQLHIVIYSSEVCGQVTFEGQPVMDAEVSAYNNETDEYFVTFTDENGYYCMGITNGNYDVCANMPDQGMMACSYSDIWDAESTSDFDFGEVAVESEKLLPDRFILYQNHPNPFNPVTTIRYDLPEGNRVRLTVYDMLGHEVTNLINDFQDAGYHATTWNGRDRYGNELATGVYIYQLKAGDFISTKKLILLK